MKYSMKARSSRPDMYQRNSPRQLGRTLRFSARLRRARGFPSFKSTPATSTLFPFDDVILVLEASNFSRARSIRSSSVGAAKYMPNRGCESDRRYFAPRACPGQTVMGRVDRSAFVGE